MDRDEALRAARCDSWQTRKKAATALAEISSYDDDVAHTALMRLLLDENDTAITLEAAEALLKRNDLYSASAVFAGLALATNSRGDWVVNAIHRAWSDGLFDAEQYSELIFGGTDPLAKFGARDFLEWQGISDPEPRIDVQDRVDWYRNTRIRPA